MRIILQTYKMKEKESKNKDVFDIDNDITGWNNMLPERFF